MDKHSINNLINARQLTYRETLPSGSVLIEDKTGFYILTNDIQPCLICGKPSNRIDVYSEGRFCGEKCEKKFYENLKKVEETKEIYA
jgi:hypothetical protein